MCIYIYLREVLKELEVSSVLPTGDDHFMDFCYYCLSLPRDRIAALLNNPRHELMTNRLYYIELNGQYVYQDQGYLIDDFDNLIDKNFGEREYIYPEAITARDFLNSYQDILISVINIPPSLNYEN